LTGAAAALLLLLLLLLLLSNLCFLVRTDTNTHATPSGTVTDINRNVSAALKNCGPAILTSEEVIEKITGNVVAIMRKQHPCQQDLGDDEDFESLEESSEYDWLVIDTALDVVIALAAALGPTFATLWKAFEKPVMKFAASSEDTERSTSVGVIAEAINCMGAAVAPFTPSLLKLLLHRLSDPDPEVKSNAAFAIGLLCSKTASTPAAAEVTRAYPQILQKLEPLLHQSEARLIDNSAGCVSRMIAAHAEAVPIAEVLPVLVGILPLSEDYDENEPVWGMIMELYRSGDETVKSLTPAIVKALGKMLGGPEGQLSEARMAQVKDLVPWLHEHVPQVVEQEEVLMRIVRG
jgi:hypothetical protein